MIACRIKTINSSDLKMKKISLLIIAICVFLFCGYKTSFGLSISNILKTLPIFPIASSPNLSSAQLPKISGNDIPAQLNDLLSQYKDLLPQGLEDKIKEISRKKKIDINDIPRIIQLLKNQNRERVVYLTFDDGPNEPFTSQILDILKRQDVKATFFVCGKNAEGQGAILQRIVNDGHNIGNHSYNHSALACFTGLGMSKEIEDTQNLIQKYTGVKTYFYRPPWGMADPKTKKYLNNSGYKVILADVLAYDWQNISSDEVKNSVLKKVKPHSIIVLHDGRGTEKKSSLNTVNAVEPIITELKKQGYSFKKIDMSTDTSFNLDRLESLGIR